MDIREVLKVNDVIYTEWDGYPTFLYVLEVRSAEFDYMYANYKGEIKVGFEDDITLLLWLSEKCKGKIHRGNKAIKIAKLMGLIS
jgi:hypothetical protein